MNHVSRLAVGALLLLALPSRAAPPFASGTVSQGKATIQIKDAYAWLAPAGFFNKELVIHLFLSAGMFDRKALANVFKSSPSDVGSEVLGQLPKGKGVVEFLLERDGRLRSVWYIIPRGSSCSICSGDDWDALRLSVKDGVLRGTIKTSVPDTPPITFDMTFDLPIGPEGGGPWPGGKAQEP